jgi:hypothetical protein
MATKKRTVKKSSKSTALKDLPVKHGQNVKGGSFLSDVGEFVRKSVDSGGSGPPVRKP